MPLVDPVLVLAEHDTAETTQATRELLAAARQLGTPVTADRSRHRDPAGLASAVRQLRPLAVLVASDRVGEELAARLAVRLEAGIVTDVAGVSRDRGALFAIQEVAGGTCRIATELRGPTPVITVRRGVFPAEQDSATVADIEHLCPRPDTVPKNGAGADTGAGPGTCRASRVVSRRSRRAAGRDALLEDADVVVAGGRGVGSAEGFSLLARLARVLGGRLGGTHTAGELGWCPDHARISLPGAQIRPRLYLAGGVSGSLRHRAAIRRARTVVAIDSDPAAPIFREADFGVVGDLHEVLPALLDELARRSPQAQRPEQRERAEHRAQPEQQEQAGQAEYQE
jgi:electron transfer flavoprotein alpha subunit